MPRGRNDYETAQIQGRLWTPDVLRPALWLDAADLSTITIATGVSEWRDKSGNGQHASQSTALNQPAYSAFGLNALPSVNFDGTNSWLDFATGFLNGATSFSVAMVMLGPLQSNDTIFGPSTTFSTGFELINVNVISKPTMFRLNNIEKIGTGLWNTDSTAAISTMTGSSTLSAGWRNGASVAATDSSGTSALNFNGVYSLGRYNSTNAAIMNMSEFVIATRDVSMPERVALEGYLSWKWGIRLAGDHPFANRPPMIGD